MLTFSFGLGKHITDKPIPLSFSNFQIFLMGPIKHTFHYYRQGGIENLPFVPELFFFEMRDSGGDADIFQVRPTL
jgi:hypothetical protein